MDIREAIAKVNKKYGFKEDVAKSLASYKLTYDSDSNQLEPIYYWILDFIQDMGLKVEKVTDNFQSSPGSGHFSDMGQRATAMQQQATKILADTNVVIKSVIQLVYDLKEYEIRLSQYKRAASKDPKEKEEGMLALKNIWLDQVDMKRGRGSIHQMSYEMGFTTLREAFLVANTIEDVNKMSSADGVINDSVKRVLTPRLSEFLLWKDISEREIVKRFEIEKSYLKSQVESLKMYTAWAKPYLKAAKDLRMSGFDTNASLVHAFSTTMFELGLFCTREAKITSSEVLTKRFGREYKLKRKYYSILVVSLKYRGELAQKVTQKGDYGFGFGGRVDITFDAYALNEEEIALAKKIMSDADLKDGLDLVGENTQVALDQLKDDIEKYCLKDGDKQKMEEEKKKEEKKQDDTNPFSALWSLFTFDFGKTEKKEDKKEIKEVKDIKKDDFVEENLRGEAINGARGTLYTVYDVYKKAHGMASSPENFDNGKKG
jgi:hypothetical protein